MIMMISVSKTGGISEKSAHLTFMKISMSGSGFMFAAFSLLASSVNISVLEI